ncbi:MAG: hypothetical protein AAGA90_07820 [Actinomycetota bacterium]
MTTPTDNPYAEHASEDGVTNGERDYTPANTFRHDLGAARADVMGQVWELGERGANTLRLAEALHLERRELDEYLTDLERQADARSAQATELQNKLQEALERADRAERLHSNDLEQLIALTAIVDSWRDLANRIQTVPRSNTGALIRAVRAGEAVQ